MHVAGPDVLADRKEKFEAWAARVGRPHPLGHCFVHTPATPLNWTPLRKPLNECTVALVTTAGVHLREQEPFAVYDEKGDWTYREIPVNAPSDQLMVTHTHYDTRDAEQDINVVFPLDRMRELADEGVIGTLAPRHYGFMGFIPDPRHLATETAPVVAEELARDGVDVALLTAG